jgi:hypothetical protein
LFPRLSGEICLNYLKIGKIYATRTETPGVDRRLDPMTMYRSCFFSLLFKSDFVTKKRRYGEALRRRAGGVLEKHGRIARKGLRKFQESHDLNMVTFFANK